MPSVEERLATLEADMEKVCEAFDLHERRQEGEFRAIQTALADIQKQLANRLPVWATLLITGMGTLLGAAVSAVVILLEHQG